MPSPFTMKDQEILQTPVLLFDCQLPSGTTEYWSTHKVTFEEHVYAPRIVAHDAFDVRLGGDDGIESISRLTLTLANADSYVSQLERNTGLKGARLHARFVFVNLVTGAVVSDPVTLFRGLANPPDDLNERTARVQFSNRLSPQRLLMPNTRIQKRCPWQFPANANQRAEAPSGLERGKYSPFFRCGYSPDQDGGVGNLDAGNQPYTSCDYTRASCQQRGMFDQDSANRPTARFGGIGFVPASVLVRGASDSGPRVSDPIENEARYNDFVPMVYGTAWYEPPIVFARNDGNLTRTEVLLGLGMIKGVVKVIVNDIEIPLGVNGQNMTATGWYNVVSLGNRNGAFNVNFANGAGQPLGDPYGSMAFLSVVVPNRVADGKRLPRIRVLLDGMELSTFGEDGGYIGESFNANPAWILLDLLRRSGWEMDELDTPSFARVAAHCDELIASKDLYGNDIQIPRYRANLVLRRRRSLAEILRGVRNGAGLYLAYSPEGKVELKLESKIALTHPQKPVGSNATTQLYSGWPAYEFGDGTNGTTGVLRRENGEPAIRFFAKSTADSPNRFSLEFQDAFNEYQQDSLSLVDADDAQRTGQEIAVQYNALGVPNFDQAARIVRLQLDKSLRGNTYVQFESSVRALGVRPGDLITLTWAKQGFDRQLFRVLQIAPRANYSTVAITAQLHDENWYLQPGLASGGERRETTAGLGLPRPLLGSETGEDGQARFGIVETPAENNARLSVSFVAPAKPELSAAAIPLLALTPEVETTGGTLAGGRSYYYAISGRDASGVEGRLSFLVRATAPQGTGTNLVRLKNLAFSPGTASFTVYRGADPQRLRRIANEVALANTFVDNGLEASLAGPPDQNFHQANFYWRFEALPETVVNSANANSVTNTSLNLEPDAFKDLLLRISQGKGAGQERVIQSHTATVFTVSPAWEIVPDTTSRFVISQTGWKPAASGATSPVAFEVPAYAGRTVEIIGVAANVNNQESAPELSPLTRWQIGAGAPGGTDTDVPPKPFFGLRARGDGSFEVLTVAFPTLENTRTVSAGTFTVHSYDELKSPSPDQLIADVDDTATSLSLDLAASSAIGTGAYLQIDEEIMKVTAISGDRKTLTVERARLASSAAGHLAGRRLYPLDSETHVLAFSRGMWGSPAASKFRYPIYKPDVRLAAAELYVTNAIGNSETDVACFTDEDDQGKRILSGGQLTLQFDGWLAIGSEVTPPLIVERDQAIRDMQIVMNEPPLGGSVRVRVNRNGTPYQELEIFSGFPGSIPVSGFGRAPLAAADVLTLDILQVPPSSAGTPGRDLTVILRR